MIDEKKLKYEIMASLHKEKFQDYKTGAKGIYYLSDDLYSLIDNQPQIGGWIPCSEPPKYDGSYIVAWLPKGMKSKANTPHYYAVWGFQDGEWDIDVPEEYKKQEIELMAWQPLPEPYKPIN